VKVQNAERLAQVEARRKSLEQMSLQERRLTELIDQVRALLVQAVHGDDNAYEQGRGGRPRGDSLEPRQRPGHSGFVQRRGGGPIEQAYRLRNLRADRFLEALYLVELAHVPFPDEPPIEWPNAQVWRALTERRKKWAQTDLRQESPIERRISEALDQTVEFNIDPEPLKDAIDFIAQRYQIPIILDAKALEDASIDTSTEVKLPYSGMKLRKHAQAIARAVADASDLCRRRRGDEDHHRGKSQREAADPHVSRGRLGPRPPTAQDALP